MPKPQERWELYVEYYGKDSVADSVHWTSIQMICRSEEHAKQKWHYYWDRKNVKEIITFRISRVDHAMTLRSH